MRMLHMKWMVLLALGASLALAACGSDEDAAKDKAKADEQKAEKKLPSPAPICPQVAVVRGLDVIHRAKDDSPDPAELIAGAKLLGVEGTCEYLDEGGIDITFQVNMIAKRGPMLDELHANYPFFVAVLDPDGNILSKSENSADVRFSSSDEFTNHAETLHVFIPLPKDKKETGPYYRVLSGFQLTKAEETEALHPYQP